MLAHSIELRASLVQTFEPLHRIHRLVRAIFDGHPVFFADVVFGGVILLFRDVSELIHRTCARDQFEEQSRKRPRNKVDSVAVKKDRKNSPAPKQQSCSPTSRPPPSAASPG
jgi:hypothetical protein